MNNNQNLNIHIIVQARTGSSRLPNKVMKYLEDKIVLQHVYDRLKESKYSQKVIITTTTNVSDTIIVDYCINNNIEVFRGSELNVLNRYYETAKYYKSDIIVRVTSDCPLIDVKFIDMMIDYYLKSNLKYLGPKYFGNHKFPDGFNGEIFNFDVLEEANNNANINQKEHVTTYIIDKYKKEEFTYPILYQKYKNIDFTDLHLSLDTPEDYNLLKKIFKNVYLKKNNFHLEDILKFLNQIVYLE
jgi:spore coat polysaccharide biosynthesis protein SpsF